MSSKPNSPIRFSCPQCGGNVKVPALQAGQKCRCPRCEAEIVAPGGTSVTPPDQPAVPDRRVSSTVPSPNATVSLGSPAAAPATPAPVPTRDPVPPAADVPVYPQPGSDAAALRPAPRERVPPEDEEFGVECQLCGSRLYARRKQIGQTVKCPDCHSPVVVKAPRNRKPAETTEYEEADQFKLSAPIELPSTMYEPPGTRPGSSSPGAPSAPGMPAGPGIPTGGGTAMQQAARRLLEKVKAEQEAEEAEEREHAPERFTQGLFEFFADLQTVVRLVVLAVWYELAVTLLRWATGMTFSEDMPAILSEAGSLLGTVVTVVVGITFLIGMAACGRALVMDTSDGLRKIEHWPGVNVRQWGRDVYYILNAGLLAALPGAALGIALAVAGIKGAILFTAAATFVGLFPPMLLSMLDSKSIWAPFAAEAWGSIRERPEPWKLTYLITTVATIAALVGVGISLSNRFLVGLVAAVVMVASLMVYFRTVGRLMGYLAGR